MISSRSFASCRRLHKSHSEIAGHVALHGHACRKTRHSRAGERDCDGPRHMRVETGRMRIRVRSGVLDPSLASSIALLTTTQLTTTPLTSNTAPLTHARPVTRARPLASAAPLAVQPLPAPACARARGAHESRGSPLAFPVSLPSHPSSQHQPNQPRSRPVTSSKTRRRPPPRSTASITTVRTTAPTSQPPPPPASTPAAAPPPVPHLLTIDEVAGHLRTTRKAVYALIRRGTLPGVIRLPRRLLVDRAVLVGWLEERRAVSLTTQGAQR